MSETAASPASSFRMDPEGDVRRAITNDYGRSGLSVKDRFITVASRCVLIGVPVQSMFYLPEPPIQMDKRGDARAKYHAKDESGKSAGKTDHREKGQRDQVRPGVWRTHIVGSAGV
jgi:hypothetical protein